MSINRWMDKQNAVCTYNGILFSFKEGGSSDTFYNMDEPWQHSAKLKKWSEVKWSEVKWSENRSVMSDSLQPHGLYSTWNSPGQNTGLGSLSLHQRIFPTQRSNPGLLHCRRILYQLSHKGNHKLIKEARHKRTHITWLFIWGS